MKRRVDGINLTMARLESVKWTMMRYFCCFVAFVLSVKLCC